MTLQAYISGQARLAVIAGRTSLECVEAGSTTRFVRSVREFDYLFGGVTDLERVACKDWKEVSQRLDLASSCDDALALLLIVLDREAGEESRLEALQFLEPELGVAGVETFLWSRLLACPLPDNADPIGALLRAEKVPCPKVLGFLETLGSLQSSVALTAQAWQEIPDQYFAALPDRSTVHSELRNATAFASLVRATPERRTLIIVEVLSKCPRLPRQPLTALLKEWVRAIGGTQLEKAEAATGDDSEWEDGESENGRSADKRFSRPQRSQSVFDSVSRQKRTIQELMREGNWGRAWQYVEELVAYQRAKSEPQLLAKSLCDLAGEAKTLGAFDRQLELSERAFVVCPGDVQTHNHRADALLRFGDLNRAEASYREAVLRFPKDAVARNGLAEVLKSVGRLKEAEAAYRATVSQFPSNAFARNGLAEVLKAAGRLEEAEAEYRATVGQFPSNAFARNGLAEVLKAAGRLEEAEAEYRATVEQFPSGAVARNGLAEVLKSVGRLEEAEAAYRATVDQFPANVVARVGLAEVLKSAGRLEEAEAEYLVTVDRFPSDIVARNGLATLLLLRGRAQAALSFVSANSTARTKEEWIAQHIRAMIHFRDGALTQAEAELREGVQQCPFAESRPFFQRALSLVKLRMKEPLQAVDALGDDDSTLSSLLRFHAFSQIGNEDSARVSLSKAKVIPFPKCGELKQALETRYLSPNGSSVSDENLFEIEFECLLAA